MSITTIIMCFMITGIILMYWWKTGRKTVFIQNMPGPNILELIKIGFTVSFGDRNMVFELPLRLFKKYGPVVFVWYGYNAMVCLKDAEHIEKICRHDPLCRRAPDYFIKKIAFPFKGGLLAIEGNEWKSRRKILNNAFHVNVLESYVDNFDRNSQILAERIKKLPVGSFHRLDIIVVQCALDIAIQTLLGYNLEVQKRNDVYMAEGAMKLLELQMKRFLKPWLFIDWIHKRSNEGRELKELMEFYYQEIIIPQAKEKKVLHKIMKKQDNTLYYFLHTENIPDEDIHGEAVGIAGAGTDTTAIVSCFALALLSEHQDIQQKVFEEQKRVFGEQFLRPVAKDDLEYMAYLEQVLKETLRLFPPIPYVLRMSADDVDIGDGYIVPKGTFVMMNAFETHRIPKYFPDPEKFDPERFSPENSIGRHPFSYIPFGLGRRMCLGKKFAMMEMKTMMSHIIRRIHFLEVKGGTKGLLDNLQAGLIISPTTDFYFKLQPR